MTLPAILGTDGVVLWDDHYLEESEDSCSFTKDYVDKIIGPLAAAIINSTKTCSQRYCGGIGRCVYLNDSTTLKTFDKVISTFISSVHKYVFKTLLREDDDLICYQDILASKGKTKYLIRLLNRFNVFELMERYSARPDCKSV